MPPSLPALLVIDVQQGLCEGEGRALDTAALITRINLASAKLRAAKAPVIFIQHESGGDYLAHGSRDWQLADGLHTTAGDIRVRKTTPDSFHNTPLQSLLQDHGVDHLIVCGLHTEFCVDTTVRRALALGYPVQLLADGHSSAGNTVLSAQQIIAHHNTTLRNIRSFGPRVSTPTVAELELGAAPPVMPRPDPAS
jgi:nicotinamidase-related amidase